jgi:hypothetical protein
MTQLQTRKGAPQHTAVRGRVTVRLRHLQFQAVRLWGALSSLFRARSTSIVLLIVLTLVDAALCFLAMYLIDLGISLMELWAELARKHFELTL